MTTIDEVARRAGVSKTTVSHVLSGNRPVSSKTRKRVEHIISELGFRPNVLASSLRTQRSQTIAFIIPDISNPFYPTLARGLQNVLAPKKYHTFLCNTDGQREQELDLLDDVMQRRVDGIVLVAFSASVADLQPALSSSIPMVVLCPFIDAPNIDLVITDDRLSACEATTYLLAQGHRRIALLNGTPGLPPSETRLAGYRDALAQAGLVADPTLVVASDFTRAGGQEMMHHLLRLAARPTAVFCTNDLMAIGAMEVAQEHGLRVPEDIAIVGFDDIEAASLVTPKLTTILNPAYHVGETAGTLLLERMDGTYTGPRRHIVIPHQLVVRASA